MPTLEDHKRAPRQYPICSLDHVWLQRGNTTGHCARCHETFEGVRLFDRHQTTDEAGRTVCKSPSDVVYEGEPLRLVDGAWRGPAMNADASAQLAAKRGLSGTPSQPTYSEAS